MELGFGHDFADVRVHADARAAADVGALAFTVGSHIVFGAGSYAPHTLRGQRLLAHELAHVIQQRPARAIGPEQLAIDTAADGGAEREADGAADRVLARIRSAGPARHDFGLIRLEAPSRATAPPRPRAPMAPPALRARASVGLQRQPDATKDGPNIKNVTLTGFSTKPKPKASQHKTLTDFIHVTLDQAFTGQGDADVADKDKCKEYRFGFIQLCRPFSVHRAIYENASGQRYEINNIDNLRAFGPQLDLINEGDTFYASDKPDCAKGGHVKVKMDDTPATVFPIQPPGVKESVFIRGLAWQEFFFTTFSVREPGKDVRHLRSLYWTILYCETFAPPASGQVLGKSVVKTAKVKVKKPDPIPAEPGIELMGKPAKKLCNDTHRSAISIIPKGPGEFDSPCPIGGEE